MLPPKQQAQREAKERLLPDALKRSADTDYTDGYFFVTLNVHDHLPILGHVTGRFFPDTKQVIEAGVRLSDLGEAVMKCWQAIPSFHPNVQLIDAVVMPEHFHGLIHLSNNTRVHLGKIINGFMVGCTHAYWDILGIAWRDMVGDKNGEADKRWTDWQHKVSLRGPSLFAPSYNETIPITEAEVETKIQYIQSNPERRIIKGEQRDCFTVYRSMTSANWTEERIRKGLCGDYSMRCNPDRLEEGWQSVLSRLLRKDTSYRNDLFALSYIGNWEHLTAKRKLPLVCHSIDEPLRARQTEAVLQAAKDGAVIVSAFISKREREIRDLLLQQGYPIVEIIDNGMSAVYKPYGRAFYYCAEGRLLQITPWEYVYQKDGGISRAMCMVMNELARLIAGVEDDWWKR